MNKICFIVPKVYPLFNPEIKSTFGGAEKQVYLLGKELTHKTNEFELHYCVCDYGQNEYENFEGINIWNTFSFKDNPLIILLKIINRVKKINPDYCIFRGDDKKISVMALFIKTLLKKDYMFWISSNTLVKEKSLLLKLLYKHSKKIIAQTEDQKEILKKNYKKESVVIKNIYKSSGNLTVTDFNKRTYSLWIGRADYIKRPEVIIDLALKYPDEKFFMIMPKATGKDKYYKCLLEKINKLKNIKLFDHVKQEDVIDYYLSAKLYIITSFDEGFSNTMMEAMDAYCPVLSIDFNPDNIIDSYEIGMCANGDMEKFYKYFQILSMDKKSGKKMGENAKKYLDQNHCPEKIVNNFRKLIKE